VSATVKPSHARYVVVGFALALAMIAYTQRVAISQAIGPIGDELKLSKEDKGWILGAFALSYALFEIPMGALGDRLGVRRVLTRIVVLWSVLTALTGAAWSFFSLLAARFLFGAGEAGAFPNLTRMLATWLPRAERVRAQALMWAFARWGGAATPPIVVLAIGAFGWRLAFVAFGVLGVLWAALFWVWFRDDPYKHKMVNTQEAQLLEEARGHGSAGRGGPWLPIVANPSVLLLVVQYTCFSFVWVFYVTWLPTWLQEAWNLTKEEAAGYATLPLLFGGFGSLISGLLPMRVPRRWVAFLGFAATAALLFAITRAPSVAVAMGCMAIASFCSDLCMPISWNTCAEVGRGNTATVAATMNMFSALANFAAPTISGFILQADAGAWNTLLYIMTGAACISALCWLLLDPEKMGRAPQEPAAGVADGA
jgi:MFS transporter, ACS family, glucarate transporter